MLEELKFCKNVTVSGTFQLPTSFVTLSVILVVTSFQISSKEFFLVRFFRKIAHFSHNGATYFLLNNEIFGESIAKKSEVDHCIAINFNPK